MELSVDLSKSFHQMNIDIPSTVLDKCVDLCSKYHIDAEDFIDQWLAYTASYLQGAPPTLDALQKMERLEFQNNKNVPIKTKTPSKPSLNITSTQTPPRPKALQQTAAVTTPKTGPKTPIRYDTPSEQFSARKGAQSVQISFGTCGPHTFKHPGNEQLPVHILNGDIRNQKYMYEKFFAKQEALDNLSCLAAAKILKSNNLALNEETFKDYAGEMVIAGRICADKTGKLSFNSVFLEGLLDLYKGATIQLNLDKLAELSLFVGQTVVLKGLNVNKSRFIVDEIISKAPLAPLGVFDNTEPLQIVIAAGPFTVPENLLYEPLGDLLEYVVAHKPNFLVLLGPFLDYSHPNLATIDQSYDDIFESIIEGILHKLSDTGVHVILVPSHQDIHSHPVFPTLPYNFVTTNPNLTLAPNPSVLNIGGLMIGACSADVLLHVSQSELFKFAMGASDRMARLVRHLFHQRCFYPLHPAQGDLRVDYQLLDAFGTIETMPNLMILPSSIRFFVKEIDGCVVINPERIIKGQYGGTFARVEVRPGSGATSERISCQVLRI